MTGSKDNGIIDLPNNHSAQETVEKLKGTLQAKEWRSSRWSTLAEKRKGICHASNLSC